MTFSNDEQRLLDKVGALSNRINQIAATEAQSALVNGWAAKGGLMAEKERLIDEVDRLLNEFVSSPDA